ncbi:MAG TPA: MarR family transcriptional regulator [Noviherbaspirillum sp.]|uniref:MarR family winged helix-turn-helix transcriptional regulator n=1 Tax=Noviherbaspirillum sp. TaxID=1926288 RepID=UPI002B4A0DA2|nr:MarR family transcriptional regulator [Noviherbaspirillum sp.]HJV85239.1 MarR family transcriptional regulator [Noviherbaspirillum sp.]
MDLPQDSFGFLIADLSRLMRQAYQQRTGASSLTLAQARALLYVARHEGIRQVDLAGLLEVQPITLARLIDHLHQEGLVERRSDPSDRRVYRLHVTPAATTRLQAIREVVAKVRADVLRNIEPENAALVLATLNRMRNNLLAHSRNSQGGNEQ